MVLIWKLERIVGDGDPTYDCTNRVVLAASDIESARRLASGERGYEGEDVWMDAKRSTCETVGTAAPWIHAGTIIAVDFHHG